MTRMVLDLSAQSRMEARRFRGFAAGRVGLLVLVCAVPLGAHELEHEHGPAPHHWGEAAAQKLGSMSAEGHHTGEARTEEEFVEHGVLFREHGEEFEEHGGEHGGEHGEEEMGELEHIDIAIGCMLLGSISLQMGLVYLMNFPDEDIMKSAWEVISSTLSIFVAVLNFHAFRELALFLEVDPKEAHWMPGFMRESLRISTFALCFLVLFVVMHWILFKQVHLNRSILSESVELTNSQRKIPLKRLETAKHRRTRITKSWAILLSHTAAFAGIHLGVEIQGLSVFKPLPSSTMVVPLVAGGCYFVLFRVSDWFRSSYMSSSDSELSQEANAEWDEEAEEAEKDIAVISISFLTIHAARYAISGVLAHANGHEKPQKVHPPICIALLLLEGGIFYILTVVLVFFQADRVAREKRRAERTAEQNGRSLTLVDLEHETHTGLDPMHVYVRRWQSMMPKVLATCGSWCLLWACKWWQVMLPTPPSLHFHANSTIMCVLLSLMVSLAMFFLVFFLDKIADMEITGPTVDVTIRAIIDSLGVLVGFTWETTFSSGLEGISELSRGYGEHMPLVCQGILAIAVSVIVIPAWRGHILRKVLELRRDEDGDGTDSELTPFHHAHAQKT